MEYSKLFIKLGYTFLIISWVLLLANHILKFQKKISKETFEKIVIINLKLCFIPLIFFILASINFKYLGGKIYEIFF